jgi:hypothetical protein
MLRTRKPAFLALRLSATPPLELGHYTVVRQLLRGVVQSLQQAAAVSCGSPQAYTQAGLLRKIEGLVTGSKKSRQRLATVHKPFVSRRKEMSHRLAKAS